MISLFSIRDKKTNKLKGFIFTIKWRAGAYWVQRVFSAFTKEKQIFKNGLHSVLSNPPPKERLDHIRQLIISYGMIGRLQVKAHVDNTVLIRCAKKDISGINLLLHSWWPELPITYKPLKWWEGWFV
jgi:hypothetical protein